jgi:phospholipase C
MVDPRRLIRRRTFMTGAAAGLAAAAMGVPGEVAEALTPPRRGGRLDDVQHVVILMQENRSFDHYYGSMRGVRGLSDRAALRLATGRDVFHQPAALRTDGGYLLPFHVDTAKVAGQDLGYLDHSWDGTHLAWAGGSHDCWVETKTELTMSYFTRADLPFHRALAGAFTTCDHYFCSVQGPTTPNRLYLWTGTIDPEGRDGGPVINNPGGYRPFYTWTTYPERLQAAGVSWQVYADREAGDDVEHPFSGDFGDNPLWLFQTYHDSLTSSDAAAGELARRGGLHDGWLPASGLSLQVDHVLADFIADCRAGTLPAVSWVVAPYGYSEHPAARPVDGAAYTRGMLQALFDNPELWESTVVLIDYDENDGFFDHLIPPVAPPGTAGEYIGGRPIGLGPRVPMTVVSPWSRGGWVNSQVFDHTSVIRFLESWTGVHEPNISAWRRAICGDLTSCFDFDHRQTTIPLLPDTVALRAKADRTRSTLPTPAPPLVGRQTRPNQEPGTAPARAIPYQPMADLSASVSGVRYELSNHGTAALQLSVYSRTVTELIAERIDLAPACGTMRGEVPLGLPAGGYDVAVHGPNGFLRRASGDLATTVGGLEAGLALVGTGAGAGTEPTLRLTLRNEGRADVTAVVTGIPGARAGNLTMQLQPGSSRAIAFSPLEDADGWYDVTVTLDGRSGYARTFAGHLENGRPSVTG